MALRIFNTLTRKLEEFSPLKHNYVRIYVCGLTVYDFMHIGHARTYLFWDVLRRYLDLLGYDLCIVINNTDIEDKIITRSNELGTSFRELAEFFTNAFYEDLRTLGALPYTITCNATDFIPQMIETIRRIIENGYGYVIDGDVFYSVERFPSYGKLSGFTLDDLIAGARVEVDARKRHPADFALWKSAKPGEPYWESPWGNGRPGWHIECSTMAYHFFEGTYDIKGGGVDNLFPHHENEIAQTYSAYHIDLARFFMHPEHLLVEGTKMSKSLGNFITVREVLKDWKPAEVRLYFLGTHYRSQMNFTREGISAAKEGLSRINQFRMIARRSLGEQVRANEDVLEFSQMRKDSAFANLARKLEDGFIQAMDDDLNTPKALGELHMFISDSYKQGLEATEDKLGLKYAYLKFETIAGVLGIGYDLCLTTTAKTWENSRVANLVERIIARRERARADRDFKTADELREELKEAGIELEDTPNGTRWRFRND